MVACGEKPSTFVSPRPFGDLPPFRQESPHKIYRWDAPAKARGSAARPRTSRPAGACPIGPADRPHGRPRTVAAKDGAVAGLPESGAVAFFRGGTIGQGSSTGRLRSDGLFGIRISIRENDNRTICGAHDRASGRTPGYESSRRVKSQLGNMGRVTRRSRRRMRCGDPFSTVETLIWPCDTDNDNRATRGVRGHGC